MIPPDLMLTIAATDCDPEQVKRLAKCLRDGGYHFRPGHHCTIEIKSLATNEWMHATLQTPKGDAQHFATTRDRDQIYNALRALQ